jgi:DNA (cytosine-5)-methyltransferase 1
MTAPLKILDLFSGIGGFSLGLERTSGFETVGFVEIDPFCRRVLAKHWPDVPCHPDVTTYEFKEGEADVVTAGFPCQDISLAGEGAGITGARSGLYREVIRALRVVRPRYAILENVAALLGRGLDAVLGDMASIGVDAEWHCIPASAVGAPHRRDRIWIVANPGGEQHEGHRAPLSGTLATELSRATTDPESVFGSAQFRRKPDRDHASTGEMADTNGEGLSFPWNAGTTGESASTVEPRTGAPGRGWWAAEPDVDRVAARVSSRVDRIRSLGNSVVPHIPQLVGRAILQAEAA